MARASDLAIAHQANEHSKRHARAARHYAKSATKGGPKAADYHRAAARSHAISSDAARLAGSRRTSAHEATLARVQSRGAAGVSAHQQAQPKGPTQKGKRGGVYRVVNGRKVYLGKSGK